MFKSLLEFIKRLVGRKPGEIEPHPHLESDQGERAYFERLFDGEFRNWGHKPRILN